MLNKYFSHIVTLTVFVLLSIDCLAFHTDSISRLGLPVLHIMTVDDEEPTCDYAFAPEGAFGITTVNNTKVPGRCVLTHYNDTLFDSGEYQKDKSGMTLKIRGNTSAYYSSKKPYKLKLEKKNDLFGRGDSSFYDKNWVLLDCGLSLKTILGNKVNQLVGMEWTPATKHVNLIINNDYRGIYLLTEQVKRNADCRINVNKETGYIIERDAYWWNENLYFTTEKYNIEYTFKYPDSEDVTEEQLTYISDYLKRFEESISNGTYTDYIDLNSWASWLIGHDILGSWDSGGSNLFLKKKDNTNESLLEMTTLWDFDGIMRYYDKWPRIHTDNFFYYPQLINNQNMAFNDVYAERWKDLSAYVFDSLFIFLNQFEKSETAEALRRSESYEHNRWNYFDDSLDMNIEEDRQWLVNRQSWINEVIGQLPTSNIKTHFTRDNSNHPFNLMGQPINISTFRGIYIKNGKKYIIHNKEGLLSK